MVKVTVTLGSARPGGVDVALRGLADQTFSDFEIIFVDGRYHKRHERVLDLVKQLGIKQPFYHVPNHRYNGIWGTPCAGYNTGFMLAEGEIVIMLLDYAYTPPGWIENHLRFHERKSLVMAPHLYMDMPEVVTKDGTPPMKFTGSLSGGTAEERARTRYHISRQKENFDEISIFKSHFDSSWLTTRKVFEYPNQDPKSVLPTGPVGYQYMHTKNDSFPLEAVLDIEGMDEHYDGGCGPGDTEFGYRFMMAGCVTWLSREANVFCLNPREILPNLNATIPMSISDPKPRWSYNEGLAYTEQRKNAIGRGQPPRAINPYSLRKRRKEIWHWRELSQEREPIIPLNDVPQDQWYKRGI